MLTKSARVIVSYLGFDKHCCCGKIYSLFLILFLSKYDKKYNMKYICDLDALMHFSIKEAPTKARMCEGVIFREGGVTS